MPSCPLLKILDVVSLTARGANIIARVPFHRPNHQRWREIADKGVKTLEVVARRLGRTAKLGASAIGRSDLAQGAAAASAEAAR